MRLSEVTGGAGVRLAIHESGPADAPTVLLVHGWAQSADAWHYQLTDPALTDRYRLVGLDLRGHGGSEAPEEGYADPETWAADVDAVLRYAGTPAVLVGWSYGGLVIGDYLRRHGTGALRGLVLVGAITELGKGHPGGRIGPVMRAALPAALSEDPEQAVPALRAFATDCAATALPGDYAQRLLGASLRTPPRVRSALFRRDVDSAEVLAAIDVPTLVVHGTDDGVVAPETGEHSVRSIPGARHLPLPGVGHLPFAEAAARFNAELAAFLDGCLGRQR